MPENDDTKVESDDGGTLRKKLEAALGENAKLKETLTGLQAAELIREKGYKHVTPSDLQGVELSEIATKAAEIETEKAAAGAEAVKRMLEAKGLAGDELTKTLDALLGNEDTQGAALERIRQIGQIQGTPPPKVEDEGLVGPARLMAAYQKK